MAYFPPTGSIVAFQSDPTKLQVTASVAGTVNIGTIPGSIIAFPTGNQSVSGSVGIVGNPSISGTLNVTGNPSISGTVLVNNGSVVAFQGTSPWVIGSVSGTVNIAGNPSISGTVLVNNGSVVAFQGTSPWVVAPNNSSMITQIGTRTTSLVSTVPSSVIVGASIFGQLPAGTAPLGSVAALQGTLPWAVAGSVVAFVSGTVPVNSAGSVVAFQGTSPWVVNFQNSSILAVPVGSTITIQQANSIVGTYAEDAASAGGDKGVFGLGIRNDMVASLVNADLDYSGYALDSSGRTLIKPFVSEDGTIISYTGSVVSGSVTLIQASAIGKKSYLTDFVLSNTGSTTTLVTFQGGDTSVVGYAIVPAGGGSNMKFNIPLKNNTSQDLAYKVAPSQSILYATIKGYQAP